MSEVAHLLGERFAVTLRGERGPWLVMVHGFGSDQKAWHHLLAALAGRYRIVTYDQMGCGRSDIRAYQVARYRQLDGFRDDLIAICEAFGIHDAILLGHSVGGMVGMLASQARPGLLRGLICLQASPRYLDAPGYSGGFTQADLDGLFRAMAANYLGWVNQFAPLVVAANNPGEQAAIEFARSLAAMRPDIAQDIARTIFQSDQRERLAHTTIPVEILQGGPDFAVPHSVADYLAQHFPHARLQRFEAPGHLPHLTHPSRLLPCLEAALRALGADRPA